MHISKEESYSEKLISLDKMKVSRLRQVHSAAQSVMQASQSSTSLQVNRRMGWNTSSYFPDLIQLWRPICIVPTVAYCAFREFFILQQVSVCVRTCQQLQQPVNLFVNKLHEHCLMPTLCCVLLSQSHRGQKQLPDTYKTVNKLIVGFVCCKILIFIKFWLNNSTDIHVNRDSVAQW